MDMRARIAAALKLAMKEKAAARLATLRLINAAIKDREIAQRGDGEDSAVGDDEVLKILAKMVKQYFAAPASSAGVERVFSAAGKMHGDLQKSAKDSTLQHSLFAAFNTD